MSRFTFCNCPAGFDAGPERHAPDCPGRSGAGKARTPVPATKAITADQRIAVLENAYVRAGEREHALRVELHSVRQQLAERDALFGAYGDTLRPFLALMVRELKANSHKGDREGWLGMTATMTFNEITYHHDKLGEALSALDYPQISEYAADVANCCMMLLDVTGLLSASADPAAQPVPTVPDGYCIMPKRLTAENGAKALLLGEFKLQSTHECPECRELEEPSEGCEICDGEGEYGQSHVIPWDLIKFIYSKAVKGLAVKAEPAKS